MHRASEARGTRNRSGIYCQTGRQSGGQYVPTVANARTETNRNRPVPVSLGESEAIDSHLDLGMPKTAA